MTARKIIKKILFTTSFLLTIANSANANSINKPQVDKDSDLYKLFDSNIFSLSKKTEEAFDAASSIYVLSSEDIRRSGATSIPEALRLVPGLQVARIDGNKWAISSRGFNGQFSNKLLVMIDGRTVYTPLFSGSFWDTLDYVLDDIEKIEIIRGSGGAIWGANAVNGIINIITKNSADTQGTYVSAIVGNQDKLVTEARYGGATEKLNHYRLYAKQVNRDQQDKLNSNQGNDDGYRQTQAGFRYDIRSIENNLIKIHGDIRSGKADSYFQTISSAKITDKHSEGGNLTVGWDKTLSKKSSFTLQTYFDYDSFDTYVLARRAKTIDVDFQYFYDFTRHHQLAAGLGYRMIDDQISEKPNTLGTIPLDYTPNHRNDQIMSAFLQDKFGLIDDVLYLTLGSKFELNDYTKSEYQPSAKLTLFPSRNQTAWASISRAVRTPTRGEHGLNLNGGAQRGVQDYDSERVIAYELGYRIKPTRKSLIDVALFYNDYSDLRTFNNRSGSPTASNYGEGESFGAEFTAKWQALDDLRLELGYDFLKLDVRNKQTANESAGFALRLAEGQSPNNQFRLRANYNINPKIEFDNIVYYVDSLPLSGSTTGADGVSSYVRLDTRLGYLLTSDTDLSIGIQNITDDKHQEFGPGTLANKTEVGRTVYFKAALRFW